MDVTEAGADSVSEPSRGRTRWLDRVRRHPLRLLLPMVLLLLALAAQIYVHRAATGDADYVAELDRRERLAMSMVTGAAGASVAIPSAVIELKGLLAQTVALPELPGLGLGIDVGHARYDALLAGRERFAKAWRRMNASAERALSADASAGELRSGVSSFQSLAAQLLVATDDLAAAVIERDMPAHYVYVVGRQMMLIQRIDTNLHRVLEGGSGVLVAADRIGRDAVLFGDVVNGLLHDSPDLELLRVTDEDLRAKLEDLGRQFREAADLIERIIGQADAVQRLRGATREVQGSAKAVASEIRDLRRLHRSLIDARLPSTLDVAVLLGVAVLSLAVAAVVVILDARRAVGGARAQREDLRRLESDLASASERAGEAEQGLRYLGRSVLQVVGGGPGMRDAATSGIEGPAAEIVSALAEWLEAYEKRTKDAAAEVAQAAGALRENLARLDRLRANQNRQVREVVSAVEDVAQSAGKAPAELGELLETTRELIDDGRSGSELVGATGSDVERIKESVEECAQTSRRVVERSQQLREVAARIEEFSDHSRMLSLNVTLQAGAGDDHGRAIANIADELERLAERSRSLVPSIDNLAESVRNEAEDAAKATKRSLWVLSGAGDRLRKAAAAFESSVRFGRRIETLLESLANANQQRGVQGLHAMRAMTELVTRLNQSRGPIKSAASGASRLTELVEVLESSLERAPIDPEPVGAVVALEEVNVAEVPARQLPRHAVQE